MINNNNNQQQHRLNNSTNLAYDQQNITNLYEF